MGDTTAMFGLGPTAAPPEGEQTPRAEALRHAAQAFEAVFLAQVLGVMSQGLADDLLGDAEGGVFHKC